MRYKDVVKDEEFIRTYCDSHLRTRIKELGLDPASMMSKNSMVSSLKSDFSGSGNVVLDYERAAVAQMKMNSRRKEGFGEISTSIRLMKDSIQAFLRQSTKKHGLTPIVESRR